jgi:anti-anti-sigma regulatory factor
MLKKIIKTFRQQQIEIILTGVRPHIRKSFDHGKVTEQIGIENIIPTVEQAFRIAQIPSTMSFRQSRVFRRKLRNSEF